MNPTDRAPAPPLPDEVLGLPRPVGRFGPVSWAALVACLALMAWGLFAHHHQEQHGLIVTDMRNPGLGGAGWACGPPWGSGGGRVAG